MAKQEHKRRAEKTITRAQALKLLSKGADPNEERFRSHKNYHVRSRSWMLCGMPMPEDITERKKFLASLHIKEKLQDSPQDIADHMAIVEDTLSDIESTA